MVRSTAHCRIGFQPVSLSTARYFRKKPPPQRESSAQKIAKPPKLPLQNPSLRVWPPMTLLGLRARRVPGVPPGSDGASPCPPPFSLAPATVKLGWPANPEQITVF
jgi:hypothetical protein